MTQTAFMTQYRNEWILGFERGMSPLRERCTTEAQVKGNSAVFLVADSNDATAVTRGVNGLIAAKVDDLTQNTCTLTEAHDLRQRTGFNITSSQGDAKRIMMENNMRVIHRKIDDDIITALATATQYVGTAASTASVSMFAHISAVLGVNNVQQDGQITALITPAAYAYLVQTPEFSSAQYVNEPNRPFAKGLTNTFDWLGLRFIVHTGLAGLGTSSETMIVFHRNAIGHAYSKEIDVQAGYMAEQDYSWSRASVYQGAKLLQASGVVLVRHNGAGYAATA